ncbi:MAG TPA: hypothetical protein VFF69_03550 [Phycisphaerales bacterium]|nr:hypothetical protein [Phycisphaerales bacterium]
MSTPTKRTMSLALVLAAAGALAGCSTATSQADHAQAEQIRADLTPELDTLYQRPDDIYNSMTIMADENGRMFMQDLGRAFYTDRPSRLTREPVPW